MKLEISDIQKTAELMKANGEILQLKNLDRVKSTRISTLETIVEDLQNHVEQKQPELLMAMNQTKVRLDQQELQILHIGAENLKMKSLLEKIVNDTAPITEGD